jgi:hypothetical protein
MQSGSLRLSARENQRRRFSGRTWPESRRTEGDGHVDHAADGGTCQAAEDVVLQVADGALGFTPPIRPRRSDNAHAARAREVRPIDLQLHRDSPGSRMVESPQARLVRCDDD